MRYVVYLLAAVGATGNAEYIPNKPAPPSLSKSDLKPRGNPGLWATTNDYPSVALQKEIEGTVGFTVTVGPDGRVADCVITSSSGFSELDLATCTNVKRRALFEPARDPSGNPTTGKYANRVRWQIPVSAPSIVFPRGPEMQGSAWARILPTDFPRAALSEKRQGKVKIEMAISSAGVVEGCKVLESSTHLDLDAESCKIASNRAKFGPALDLAGQPTAGRVEMGLNWRIPERGTLTAGGSISDPFTIPKKYRPKAGASTMSYKIATDGRLIDCVVQSDVEMMSLAADAMCKAKTRMEPFIDSNGKPIARRVTVNTSVKIEDVN